MIGNQPTMGRLQKLQEKTQKISKNRSLRMNGSQITLVVITCAHALSVRINEDKRVELQLGKRWVRQTVGSLQGQNSTVGAMRAFVLFHF